MGGADSHDMLVALYRSNIGVRRFYLRIVLLLTDICVLNAWLLYRRHCDKQKVTKYMSLLKFRSEIAHGLLQADNPTVRKRGRQSEDSPVLVPRRRGATKPTPTDCVRYDGVSHWPVHIEKEQVQAFA